MKIKRGEYILNRFLLEKEMLEGERERQKDKRRDNNGGIFL